MLEQARHCVRFARKVPTKNRYLGSETYEAETLSDAVMFIAAWACFYRGRNQSFITSSVSGIV